MSTATTPLALQGELTIVHAAEQRTRLLSATEQALAASTDLALDLSAIEAFDSAGLQLLMATRKSLATGGKTLHISRPSNAISDVLLVYGLTGWPSTATGAHA
jgi:anti-sigma B factor antagonist